MDYARLFAYSTGVMFISLGAAVFIESIIPLITGVEVYGQFLLWAIVVIVYFNLSYTIVKRFMRKEMGITPATIILASIIFFIPLIYLVLRLNFADSGGILEDQTIPLITFIAVSVYIGWRFGKKTGLKLQSEYMAKITEMIEQQENLPDDLQRPHDSINKN